MELAPIPCLSDPGGQQHELDKDIVTIGRAIENDIVVTSKRVSREHARIRREGRKLLLEDLGSTNGTFVNEKPVTEAQLKLDSRLRIGETIFRDEE